MVISNSQTHWHQYRHMQLADEIAGHLYTPRALFQLCMEPAIDNIIFTGVSYYVSVDILSLFIQTSYFLSPMKASVH